MIANINIVTNGDGWPNDQSTISLSGGGCNSLSVVVNSGVGSASFLYGIPGATNIYGTVIYPGFNGVLSAYQPGAPSSGVVGGQQLIPLQSGTPIIWYNKMGNYNSPFGTSGGAVSLYVSASGPGGQLQVSTIFNPAPYS